MYFSNEDKKIFENLKYDKSLKPRFDWIKNCLFWKDEEAYRLSDDGNRKLAGLWIARFFIYHSGLSEEKWWINNKDFYKGAWSAAIDSGLKWPGFEKSRLYLSKSDKEYLAYEMKKPKEI